MENYILAIRCQIIIFILSLFLFKSILGYYVIIIILKLKGDRLSEFLDAIKIPHIPTRMLLPDTKFYLSKIL